jgi:hypothetical protein
VLECNTSTAVNGIATTAIADPAVLIVSPNQNNRKFRSRNSPVPTIPSLPPNGPGDTRHQTSPPGAARPPP